MDGLRGRKVGQLSLVAFGFFFIINAFLIIQSDYVPGDGDSRFYMAVARQIEHLPFTKKIAPEWNGHQGIPSGHLIQDHLVGLPFTAAAVAKLGLDAGHALLILNLFFMAASFYLLYRLCRTESTRTQSWLVIAILLICPIAFLYRLRANHEPAVLFSTILLVWSVFCGFQRSPKYFIGLPLAFVYLILVKGFMALFLIPVSFVIAYLSFKNKKQLGAFILTGVAACIAGLLVCYVYELWYHAATGEGFFKTYWQVQIVRRSLADPATSLPFVLAKLKNMGFYTICVVWYTLPALLLAAWGLFRAKAKVELTALQKSLLAAGIVWMLMACASDRITMRYIFPSYFLIATAFVSYGLQQIPTVKQKVESTLSEAQLAALVTTVWGFLTLAYGLLT